MFTPSRFNAPSQEIETSLTSPLPGCKIEQSCFPRSKYYSEIYGEFFGSLLPLEPTSMTTVEHRRDKDMVPILVEIELKVAYWERLASEEDVQPSQNSFNHKSKRTRCPCVGVSLECVVQSWHPSALGGILERGATFDSFF